MTPNRALLFGAAAGIGAAVVLPLDRPGLGWALTALLVFGLLRKVRPGWAVLSVALFSVGIVIASDWLFALCAIAGCAAGSLAVVGGRTARGVVFGTAAVPVAAVRALPWLTRGVKERGMPPLARPLSVTVGLLLVFVPLLAGADAAFAELLRRVVPGDASGQPIVAFLTVGLGTAGAGYLITTPPDHNGVAVLPRTLSLRDWVLPVGALVVLFGAFVAVQFTTLFAGDEHVITTAGLTYADYARSGFWQLLAVTVLTLVVIATVARLVPLDSPTDRTWLRVLLGALSVLTLVIVASALTRMWLYQQAYGFTVLRVLVAACELWLGVVYALVLAAGVKLRAAWLARAIVGTGFATLLALAALNPDRFIAERNIDRWEQTGKIDVRYLSGLSEDAVPVLATLPSDLRACALELRHVPADDWRSWNLGRQEARDALGGVRPGACTR